MSTLAALALMAALSGPSDAPAARPLPVLRQEPQADAPVRLEDIEVTGRPLDALISGFIDEVAAPVRHRGLARWEGVVCVGAARSSTTTRAPRVARCASAAMISASVTETASQTPASLQRRNRR